MGNLNVLGVRAENSPAGTGLLTKGEVLLGYDTRRNKGSGTMGGADKKKFGL